MNAETRAKEMMAAIAERGTGGWRFAAEIEESLPLITQAIAQAQNDKLEEARQRILEGHDEAWGNPAEQHGWDKAAERVAALISKKD